ncbi:MAG: GH3 auxin-responsive promoter family protein [Cyanobacteria bacterium SZAS LIN-2]|nr:GH3 auxin-responsive promoter family protein [Cyanobacteria bacterium SZAS LIN-3]MBS1995367.1 GH3 auxin-responsive promoter family protein [Cyanobacteria bacterium SZAS LIN-2]
MKLSHIVNADILLAQAARKLTHVRHFYGALKNPEQAQLNKLMQIVRANENSAFGKAHSFDRIKSYEDYCRLVPATGYEGFEPYIDKLRAGEKSQLTVEDPFMFATTSGTTDKPKFVPITRSHLRDYTHAFQLHNYHLIKDFPRAALGKFLIMASNDEEGITESGLPYGAVSGLLNRRQAPIIKRHFAVPSEISKIKDVEIKYYTLLRIAMCRDVTAVLACNPSSLLLLGDKMADRGPELIKDIADGGLSDRIASELSPQLRQALAPYLAPRRDVAERLSALLQVQGRLVPSQVWPDLGILSCWKGGPMAFYLDKTSQYFGDVQVRDFGYMASEGRGSIPISSEGAGGPVALTSHFFEFVPEDEIDKPNPRFKLLHQLEAGQRYFVFFTTNAGLYRYNINDLVEVESIVHATPAIKFVRKGAGISSITGEKITEEQVLRAFNRAVTQSELRTIKHFTVEVELSMPPHYVLFLELEESTSASVLAEFAALFDSSLKAQNPEYQDKRDSSRLAPPRVRSLPPGTYQRLRQQRVAEGAPEAQVKIPLLSQQGVFAGRLQLIDGVRS